MKQIKALFYLSALLIIALSCSDDDETSIGDTLFQTNGTFNCELSESCQDVFEFEFQAGTRISLTVDELTGDSVARLAVHAPAITLGGTNLLTGNTTDLECTGQDEELSETNIVLPSSGIYQIALTRDWGSSAGFDGSYRFTLFADTPFQNLSQTIDDLNSLASGSSCP